jgi:bleomycin hydrolase
MSYKLQHIDEITYPLLLNKKTNKRVRYEEDKISLDFINECKNKFNDNPTNIITRNIVVSVGSLLATIDSNESNKISHSFLNTLKKKDLKCTNQGESGRCWMFSGLNIFKHSLIEALNLDNFEFSYSYLFFWDKFERSNTILTWFINNINNGKNKYTHGDRIFDFMLKDFISDGGYWNFFTNLVQKYGLIPKHAMHESFHSDYSNDMNEILNDILQSTICIIHTSQDGSNKLSFQNLLSIKNNILQKIYDTLVKFLGEPPNKFTWHYTNSEGDSNSIPNLNPHKFYKMVIPSINLDDFVILSNMPSNNMKLNQLYQIKHSQNIIEGKPCISLNLPIHELVRYTTKSILSSIPVWFACDVCKDFNVFESTLNDKIINNKSIFGNTIENLDKGKRMKFKNITGTHAMLFIGVNIDNNNKPINFQIENSWGYIDHSEPGLDGFLSMSVGWFKKYVTEIVIHKNLLTRHTKKLLTQTPILLEPWDEAPSHKISGINPPIKWINLKNKYLNNK